MSEEKMASRRTILQAGAAVLGVAASVGTAKAQQKIEKPLVMYQDKPKGAQRCDNCLHWQPPAGCAIVAGTINPAGWCGAYAPKPT